MGIPSKIPPYWLEKYRIALRSDARSHTGAEPVCLDVTRMVDNSHSVHAFSKLN